VRASRRRPGFSRRADGLHSTAAALIELGALLFALGVLGRLAGRIGISPVPLYLLGGLAFGEGGLLPLGGIEGFTELAGEVGVVLLLLLLGLEYFVVFGLNTDPALIPGVLPAAVVLALVSTVTKLGAGWFAAGQIGVGTLGRLRAGTALVARGEFSNVIAGLALTSGAVAPGLAPLATTYVLIMAVLGPACARLVEPTYRKAMARAA
jgi:Kef-type K+ transport system membrane component KefB